MRALLLPLAGLPLLVLGQTPGAGQTSPGQISAQPQGPTLTFGDAVRLARERNGTVVRAAADIRAARARVSQQQAAFLPSVTPRYAYTDNRQTFAGTQSNGNRLDFVTQGAQVNFAYTLFDTGQRLANLRNARAALGATDAAAISTIRDTLFSVEQAYVETLRAQELLRVATSTLERARIILDQTEARVRVGDAAARETLQARADVLNAEVDVIEAQNTVTSNAATLKALAGITDRTDVPTLDAASIPTVEAEARDLEAVIAEGLENRPDLAARRFGTEQGRQSARLARINAGFQLSLDASYVLSLTDSARNSQAAFVLSYPLFDGGLRRAQAREAQANVDATQADLTQSERDARAEIETAYIALERNARRVIAATSAQEAARLNFEAARESQRLGASALPEVVTAQVSLVTSETNLIQARYDALIASLRLRLATGRTLPGEESAIPTGTSDTQPNIPPATGGNGGTTGAAGNGGGR